MDFPSKLNFTNRWFSVLKMTKKVVAIGSYCCCFGHADCQSQDALQNAWGFDLRTQLITTFCVIMICLNLAQNV